ncbi:DUF1045 domain-containing protein [Raineyella sp. LH-20]|uniref:DUF1045 domain-containing protein n=1 Tax=Raineyella sp. LH-20 TaxID=3081204 RepID=UPI002952BA97|nr:DUF1045 domain-containing protein [Raineyella sp. LH-20]WOP18807.1 DUF1045 domain-containing protein [Raineyella sp. LH-20]
MSPRYAIYALPGAVAPDPLRRLAEAWIGRTVEGRTVEGRTTDDRGLGGLTDPAATPAVTPAGWTRDELDAITVDARRYGFHATLKAPFRLADGITADDLDDRVAQLAADLAPAVVPRIGLRLIDGFYALTAGDPAPGLHALADAVVRTLDDLRAPLTDADRARRHPERLSARQRELLDAWGYPYVFDEFLPHLTLTDRIAEPDRPRVSAALAEHFEGQLDRDVAVDALCVFVEPAPGSPFVLRSVHPLRGLLPHGPLDRAAGPFHHDPDLLDDNLLDVNPLTPPEPAAAGDREGEA